jgi:hypothetical protein
MACQRPHVNNPTQLRHTITFPASLRPEPYELASKKMPIPDVPWQCARPGARRRRPASPLDHPPPRGRRGCAWWAPGGPHGFYFVSLAGVLLRCCYLLLVLKIAPLAPRVRAVRGRPRAALPAGGPHQGCRSGPRMAGYVGRATSHGARPKKCY